MYEVSVVFLAVSSVVSYLLQLGLMLGDDLIEQHVPLLLQGKGLGEEQPCKHTTTNLGQPREAVVQVEPGDEYDLAVDDLLERGVPAVEPPEELAGHGAAHHVVCEDAEHLRHVHRRGGGGVPDLGDDEGHLLLSGAAEGLHLGGAEHVRGHQPPDQAPVVAVGRQGDVGVAEDDVGHGGGRPRREGVVVRAQDGLGRAWGRHHQAADLAEAEQHEPVLGGAVHAGGDLVEGEVRVGAK